MKICKKCGCHRPLRANRLCGFCDAETPAVTNPQASQQPAPIAWEEALREWWRTGVLNPKIIAVEDAFKAGWDARAALSTPMGTHGRDKP